MSEYLDNEETDPYHAVAEIDPVWEAIMRAPFDDEPETEDEIEAMLSLQPRDPDGVKRMREWLDSLPPPWDEIYEDLKRMDPKHRPRASTPHVIGPPFAPDEEPSAGD